MICKTDLRENSSNNPKLKLKNTTPNQEAPNDSNSSTIQNLSPNFKRTNAGSDNKSLSHLTLNFGEAIKKLKEEIEEIKEDEFLSEGSEEEPSIKSLHEKIEEEPIENEHSKKLVSYYTFGRGLGQSLRNIENGVVQGASHQELVGFGIDSSSSIGQYHSFKTPSFKCIESQSGSQSFVDEEKQEPFKENPSKKEETFYHFEKNLFESYFSRIDRVAFNSEMKTVKKVAIKQRVLNNETIIRVQNELEVFKRTKAHPKIMEMLDGFCDRYKYTMILEDCSGGALFEVVMKAQKISEEDVARIMAQILNALSFLHSKNLVHGKLDQASIAFKTPSIESDLKLIGFGNSQVIGNETPDSMKIKGNSLFFAPEVLLKRQLSPESDIWSTGFFPFLISSSSGLLDLQVIVFCANLNKTGVIMHILLFGFPPFVGNSTDELLLKSNQGLQASKNSYLEKISRPCKDLLLSLLSKDPKARPKSSSALCHPWFSETPSEPFGLIFFDNLNSFLKSVRILNTSRLFLAKKTALKLFQENLSKKITPNTTSSFPFGSESHLRVNRLRDGELLANGKQVIDQFDLWRGPLPSPNSREMLPGPK